MYEYLTTALSSSSSELLLDSSSASLPYLSFTNKIFLKSRKLYCDKFTSTELFSFLPLLISFSISSVYPQALHHFTTWMSNLLKIQNSKTSYRLSASRDDDPSHFDHTYVYNRPFLAIWSITTNNTFLKSLCSQPVYYQ